MRYFKNRFPELEPGTRVDLDTPKWRDVILQYANAIVQKMPPTFDNCEGGLYTGCGGVAYMFYYMAQTDMFQDLRNDLLTKARNYTDVAMSYASSKRNSDPPGAFLLGSGGIYAVGSLVYDAIGQNQASAELNKKYRALAASCTPMDYLGCGSDEFLVGRAGYLCGTRLLNKKFGEVVPQESIHNICRATIHSGREYVKRHNCSAPLMYAYYETEYLGAAHGLSGILQMLMHFPSFLTSDPSAEQQIHDTVDLLLSFMQTDGNIAPAMDEIGRNHRAESEELVHWCHGAPGAIYLFARAFLLWKDDKYLQACLRCGELIWRKGLLKKGPGICHGVAGSGYAFLLLYRLTSDERHLHRAQKFAEFILTDEFQRGAKTPDTPFSLYEGLAGTVCFLVDLQQPLKAEFPFFDVFT